MRLHLMQDYTWSVHVWLGSL